MDEQEQLNFLFFLRSASKGRLALAYAAGSDGFCSAVLAFGRDHPLVVRYGRGSKLRSIHRFAASGGAESLPGDEVDAVGEEMY